MLKYINYAVTFAEIPDEVSLCLSITNCDGLCEGCHSPELRGDFGRSVSADINSLIQKHNYGISCVCFLGEGAKDPSNKQELLNIVKFIRTNYPELKIALYSGKTVADDDFLEAFDYYKIGPYMAKYGPLDKPTTNQRLYKIENGVISDITSKFWRKYEDINSNKS